jgi:type IX secretion system PorP/SprF family membrane protein
MLRSSFCALLFLLVAASGLTQEIPYTQQLLAPSERLVGLTGYHGGIQSTAQYMDRWPGIPVNDEFLSVGVDAFIPQLKGGIGINAFHHRENGSMLKTNGARLRYATVIQLKWAKLSFGGSYGFSSQRIDWSAFGEWPEPALPDFWGAREQINIHQGSLGGVLVKNDFLFALQGGVLHRAYFYDQPDAPAQARFSFTAYTAKRFHIRENFALTPSLAYWRTVNSVGNPLNHLSGAVNLRVHKFLVGGVYRWRDTAAIQLGYDLFNTYLISYSYEITVNALSTQRVASHQLGLRFTFNKNHQDRALIQDLWVL